MGALIVMLFSSATYNAFAKSLTSALSPLSLVVLSEILTGTFVLLSFGFIPVLRDVCQLKRREFLPLLLIGILSGVFAPCLLFIGLSKTSAVNTTLFSNTEMLFLLLFAVVFLRERLFTSHYLALSLIVAGLLIIALRGFTEGFVLHAGDVFVILSSLCYGIGDVLFRKYLLQTLIHVSVIFRSIVATGIFLAVSLLFPQPLVHELSAFPITLLPVLLGFAFISRFLNLSSFYAALELLPVSTMSILSNLTILTSIAFSCWFLGETIFPYQIVGGFFILTGAVLIECVGKHHASPIAHRRHMQQKRAQRA
jgi:drug/metabolite transporter (DMT)-like permease